MGMDRNGSTNGFPETQECSTIIRMNIRMVEKHSRMILGEIRMVLSIRMDGFGGNTNGFEHSNGGEFEWFMYHSNGFGGEGGLFSLLLG